MYQTIRVSSCVSAQGELVEHLPNGDAVVRDGGHVYRGRPIVPVATPARLPPAIVRNLRAVTLNEDD